MPHQQTVEGENILQNFASTEDILKNLGIEDAPIGPPVETKSVFQRFFEPEIGAITTIQSPFLAKQAQNIIFEDAKRTEELRKLFRRLPEGEQKERLRDQFQAELDAGPTIGVEELLKPAAKSTSQAFRETLFLSFAISPIGLPLKAARFSSLAAKAPKAFSTPISELIGIGGTSFGKRLLRGGLIGASVSGALALSEEGELKDKWPKVAAMTGFGALGFGLATAAFPPLLTTTSKGFKFVWDKVVPPRVESQLVMPVIRFVDKVLTAQIKFETDKVVGMRPAEREIGVLQKRIAKLRDERDNFDLQLRTQRVVPFEEEIKITQRAVKGAEKAETGIELAEKEIEELEIRKKQLLAEAVESNFKVGEQIFNKDIGRVTVRGFMSDEFGRPLMIGEDINGRIVTVMPEDLASMKRISKVTVREYEGLPKSKPLPVQLNVVQRVVDGMRRHLKTSGPFIEKLGEGGKQLVRLLNVVSDESRLLDGRFQNLFSRTVRRLGFEKKGLELTKEEMKNIIDIMDAGLRLNAKTIDDIPIQAINDRVRQFVIEVSQNIIKPILQYSRRVGIVVRDHHTGKTHPLGEALIHFPHIPKDKQKLLEQLPELAAKMAQQRNLTEKQANALLHRWIEDLYVRRYAGLEQARTLLIEGFDELERFGYETNPLVAFRDFIQGATRRIVEADKLGVNERLVARLIESIRAEGYDFKLAQELVSRFRAEMHESVSAQTFSETIRSAQTIVKLVFAPLLNATQFFVNESTEFGIRAVLRQFRHYQARRTSREEAATLADVTNSSIDRAIRVLAGDQNIVSKYLRAIGFSPIERWNRVMTVATSQEWAIKDALPALIRDFANGKYRRELLRLGLSNDEINTAVSKGRWSQDQLNRIGLKAVDSGQFRYGALDLPLSWQSPWGKVATQFKSFVWQQGTFVKNVIVDEARNGNYHPLMTFLLVTQMLGEPIIAVKRLPKAVTSWEDVFRTDLNMIERVIDTQLSVAGLGILGEAFERMYLRASGKYYVSSMDLLVGPTVSDIADGADSFASLIGGNPNQFVRFMSRFSAAAGAPIPIPGAPIITRVLGDIAAQVITNR